MTNIREELDRIAGAARTPFPDPTLWDRGRQRRRNGRLATSATTLVVVLLVGGLTSLFVAPSFVGSTQVAAPADGPATGDAIPSRIEDPSQGSGPLETNLTVGRGSVAFVSNAGEPVVVTAKDGVAHRLSLTGWADSSAALALSPDGRTLAYQQDPDNPDTTIGVLDLETGRTSNFPVHPEDALRLREITWSPDGSWLAWIGDGSSKTSGSSVGGFRTTGRGQRIVVPYSVTDVAVANDGTLFWGRDSGGIYRSPVGVSPVRVASTKSVGVGVVSPNGQLVALRSTPGHASHTLVVDERKVVEHPFPADTIGPSEVRPLGWIDERLQLLMVQPSESSAAELVITTPEVNDTSTWRRSVGAVSPEVTDTVSVAVDLIPDLDGTSSQRFTHDFADPGSDTTRWRAGVSLLIGLGVAALLSALFLLQRLWRRDKAGGYGAAR